MAQAYKGYLIRQTLGGETFIERGGQLIGWATSPEAAESIIDQLEAL